MITTQLSLFAIPLLKNSAFATNSILNTSHEDITLQRQNLLDSPLGKTWKKLGVHPKKGVSISLTGLHSEASCGIGEYTDLIPFLSWCHEVGFDVVQLLPLNDSYHNPFQIISSCALSTRYLGLRSLPMIQDFPDLMNVIKDLSSHNQDLRVDISWIEEKKYHFLRKYYEKCGHKIKESPDYKNFVHENQDWLIDYSLFKTLAQSSFNLLPLDQWDDLDKNLNKNRQKLLDRFGDSIEFYHVMQYLCFSQLAQAKTTADRLGLLLMGDLPLTVAKTSADVFAFPQYFYTKNSLGEAPNKFVPHGKDWDLTALNWDHISEDGYSWTHRRLEVMSKFYSIYRLNHTTDYYRQWLIPDGKWASEGYFIPTERKQQLKLGYQTLSTFIQQSDMMPIADYFIVDRDDLVESIKELGIPSLQLSYFQSNSSEKITYPKEVSPYSFLTLSKHSSDIFSGFWSKNTPFAKHYAYRKGWRYLRDLPIEYLHHELKNIYNSSASFIVCPLQEFLWMDKKTSHLYTHEERIYILDTVSPWNWGYRYAPSIENLENNSSLKKTIKSITLGLPNDS